jgi:hypothetical protein
VQQDDFIDRPVLFRLFRCRARLRKLKCLRDAKLVKRARKDSAVPVVLA